MKHWRRYPVFSNDRLDRPPLTKHLPASLTNSTDIKYGSVCVRECVSYDTHCLMYKFHHHVISPVYLLRTRYKLYTIGQTTLNPSTPDKTRCISWQWELLYTSVCVALTSIHRVCVCVCVWVRECVNHRQVAHYILNCWTKYRTDTNVKNTAFIRSGSSKQRPSKKTKVTHIWNDFSYSVHCSNRRITSNNSHWKITHINTSC